LNQNNVNISSLIFFFFYRFLSSIPPPLTPPTRGGYRTPLIFAIAVIFRTPKGQKVKNFYPLKSRVSRIVAREDPEIP
jgi:hypothetical protein